MSERHGTPPPPGDPARPRYDYAPDPSGAPPRPVVSVVTPVFDPDVAALRATAASVFGQSLQHFEWILVDDASTDPATAALLAELAADARVRVLRMFENRGRSAARNAGFRAAASELVYVLDQDDLLEPTALEKCCAALHAHPGWGFVNGWCQGFGAQSYRWERGFEGGADFLRENAASGRALVRRAVFEAAGGYDESLRDGFEDWDFWLRCAARGSWGATLPERLDWFRRKDPPAGWESPERVDAMRRALAERHGALAGRFPSLAPDADPPFADVPDAPAFANPLRKQRPRLLLIVPWLALGGADRFNLSLVRGLAARGVEVTVATTQAGDHGWEDAFARATPDCFALARLLPLREQPRFLRHLIESRRPDAVLVSNSELGYLLLPFLRAHCPGPVYADFCHMEQPEWKSGGYPRLSRLVRRALDATITSSAHLRDWMIERGADAERVGVAYTGIDAAAWRRDHDARKRLREAWQVADEEAVLVYAARLCEQKQPAVFAATVAQLARRGVPFRAVVAGDGPLRPALEGALSDPLLAGRVRLLGGVGPDAMREVLSAGDVFFLPSRMEGIALSLFEAMALELPVVSADVGGQRELVTPACGLLLPPAEPVREAAAYADALEPLLRDVDLRRTLGRRGRARVEASFSLERMLDAIEAILRTAREAPRPEPLLSPAAANAWATQAIEFVRMQNESGRLAGERDALAAALHAEHARRGEAESRLHRIEASRALRALRGMKRNALYRAWARWRYGADWERSAP
ncbi:MAG: glycosyl transferase family 1 [Proteobacteria bacterium]|nr:MAG: glycosyl transferase family 1 [Pseudomonadota bacterium]